MLYYLVMNHSNHFSQKKPIEDVLQNLESLIIDIKGIKTDIHHIKVFRVIRNELETPGLSSQ